VRSLDEVSNLINCLSNDEDTRQDLWVHYLSGNTVESFNARLKRIKIEHNVEVELQNAIWQLLENPISEELSNLIKNNFTDYERSILCCLMLGLDSSKISEIKGISQVRIKQTLATIRYNKCWEEAYGTKEKSDRRRKVRSQRRRD
jgi:hypothetical protein